MVRPKPDEIEPVRGEVWSAVQAFVGSLDLGDDLHLLALVALASSTAAQIDAGLGMAHAAASRELRLTLIEITGGSKDGGDDDDAFARWERDLSHPS